MLKITVMFLLFPCLFALSSNDCQNHILGSRSKAIYFYDYEYDAIYDEEQLIGSAWGLNEKT